VSTEVAEPATAPDAHDRGRTELSERAVERLVVAAAAEVDGVAAPVSRVLGQALGSADMDGRVSATIRLAGDLVTVDLRLSVQWPCSIPGVADRVRHHIEERLGELAELRVGYVDIAVTALPVDRRSRRRVD
jgi:uncharacterized alkaline shock family protein YloU